MILPLLFGNATRVRLLRSLAREDNGLSQRAIAAKIGRSPASVNEVIHELIAIGIVTIDKKRKVKLDKAHPLFGPLVETLDRFSSLEGYGKYLRKVIEASNDRFEDRYYVGGYLAATRTIQPIDFNSTRCDLYVKGLRPMDSEWVKGLRKLSPYDVRLHDIDRIKNQVVEHATLDDIPCLLARPEIGVIQCLEDPGFPRYGAILLLVQLIEDTVSVGEEDLEAAAQGTRWSPIMNRLVGFIKGLEKQPPPGLKPDELRELRNALDTVKRA